MISNKRRKLDLPEAKKSKSLVFQKGLKPTNMAVDISAFAVTKQLKAVADSGVHCQESRFEESERPIKQQEDRVFNAELLAHSKHEVRTFQEALGFDIVNNSKSSQSNGENISESFEDDDSQIANAVTYVTFCHTLHDTS